LEKIVIRGLTKGFPARHGVVTALQNLDLVIREGEFCVLLGPSGCGKTTLIRIIAGLERQTSGEIAIVRTNAGKPLTAMVFQEESVFPWMTVEANIGYGLRMQGTSPEVTGRTVREYLDMVGLNRFAEAYPFQLSGGMKQRVSVARAFAADPEVLLMDEPFGQLDEQTRVLLQAELMKIWEGHRKTVVFITHSIDEAVVLADRILLMTSAPGQIKEVVDVPFPRPRQPYEMRSDPRYGRLTQHLWELLRAEVSKAKAEEVRDDVRGT
jgi:NitT/TauT family transport system ATP-binding protein